MIKRIVCILLIAFLLLGLLLPIVNAAEEEAPLMVSSQTLMEKMKAREGFSATPYWDHSHYSIGYGTTCPGDKVSYYKKHPMTEEEAEVEFKKHLGEFEADVHSFAKKHNLTLEQHQFDALVSFSYNCGSSWMSSLSGYFNTAVRQGDMGAELLYGMALYSTAGGEYILIGRRLWEANMYLNGQYGEGEKGSYPDNYRWVFLDGNGGKVRYKICAFDTEYKASLPEAFEEIPLGTDKDGKTFVYAFAGWYTAAGKKVTQLDSSLTSGQQLYARWTDPEGNFLPDVTLPDFPIQAKVTTSCNIRKGPGTNYGKNGKLEKGDTVKVTQEAAGTNVSGETTWCKIGTDKWVTKAYLEYQYPNQSSASAFPREGRIVNVNENVNIRKGPGTSFEKNGTIARDAKVTVLSEVRGDTVNGTELWCKLDEDQYISKYFVQYFDTETEKPADDGGTKLTGLKLVKAPKKVKYVQPITEPDWEGSVLLATYKNGYQKAFTVTRAMVDNFDGTRLGEQTVTAEYGGKSVSFTVSVSAMKAPAKVKGSLTEGNGVNLSWEKGAGATHYAVSYRKAGDTAFTQVAVTDKLSCQIPKLTRNAEYQFRVQSCYRDGGSLTKGATTEITLFINSRMNAPTNLKATNSGETAVTLSWKKAKGATHYDVLYRAEGQTKFTSAGMTQSLKYTVSGLKTNTEYEFKIVSYIVEGKKKEEGPQSHPVTVFLHPTIGKATGLTVRQTSQKQAKLTWKAGEHVSYYQVQYKLSGEENYTVLATTNKLSYTAELPQVNATFQYRVVSYYAYGGHTVQGPVSAAVNLKAVPMPEAPRGLKAVQSGNGQVQLTWEAAMGATHYYVHYRKPGGKFTRVGITTDLTYTIADLDPNGTYDFRVVSYHRNDVGTYKGDGANARNVTLLLKLSAPGKLKASLSDYDDVTLSWKAATGATHYYVYYRKAGTTTFKRSAIVTGLTHTITDLTDNAKYEFQVISYFKNATGNYQGDGTKVLAYATTRDLAAPKKVTVKLYGHDDVTVSWSKVKNASAYQVYCKKEGAKSFSYLGRTTDTYFKKANLADGKKYTFKVMPCTAVNGGYYRDDSSKTATVTTLKKVANAKVTKYSSTKTKLSWTDISGESGYQVAVYSNKACTKKVTVTTTTGKYKTIAAKKNVTYYYKVRAYKTVDGKKIYAPWSDLIVYKLK